MAECSLEICGFEPEELPGLIHDALRNGAEKRVYLAVDSCSKFADTALVVEQIGKTGIREMRFPDRNKKTPE